MDTARSGIITLPDDQLRPLLQTYEVSAARSARRALAFTGILAVAILLAAWVAEINPSLFFAKIGNFTSYIDRIGKLDSGARVWTDPVEWFWGIKKWGRLLFETIVISYLGTISGAVFAVVLCFLAASNITGNATIRFAVRRFLEFCRTVPDIVFALIFVVAFGVGPLPGVLAIMIHTTGALGKLFTEVVENIDMKPVEGLRASGANAIETVRFAAIPQVLTSFLSYGLLRFEVNVRGATVMGFVGAGGIGDEFLIAIRRFYYSDVSAILVLVALTVFTIDILTSHLRLQLGAGERV